MITSGTMTHRLKLLEKRGFITRRENPDDARSLLVALTPQGLALINQVVEVHVANERDLLACLTPEQINQLDHALSLLMRSLEAG